MQNERTFPLTEEDVLRAVTVSASFVAFPLILCCHVSFVYSVGDSKLALQILPVNLTVMGDSERGTICPSYPRCNGRLVRQVC